MALALGDYYARFRVFDLKEPRVRKADLFPDGDTHGANGPAIEAPSLNATTVEDREGIAAGFIWSTKPSRASLGEVEVGSGPELMTGYRRQLLRMV